LDTTLWMLVLSAENMVITIGRQNETEKTQQEANILPAATVLVV